MTIPPGWERTPGGALLLHHSQVGAVPTRPVFLRWGTIVLSYKTLHADLHHPLFRGFFERVASGVQHVPEDILSMQPPGLEPYPFRAIFSATQSLESVFSVSPQWAELTDRLTQRDGVCLSEYVRVGAVNCVTASLLAQCALENMGVLCTLVEGTCHDAQFGVSGPHTWLVYRSIGGTFIYDVARTDIDPLKRPFPYLAVVCPDFLDKLRRERTVMMEGHTPATGRVAMYGINLALSR